MTITAPHCIRSINTQIAASSDALYFINFFITFNEKAIAHNNIPKDMNFTETIELALEKYGAHHQEHMMVEEMGELATALNHYHRGRCSIDDVRLEIADVFIMIKQMRCLYGKDEVDKAIKLKLQRLQNRLTRDNDNA